MASDEVVRASRTDLGPVGVLLPVSFTSTPTAEQQRDAVARLERAGARAAWTNEVVGKDALVQLGVLLAGLPPASTAQARATLGPDKLLVVGMTTIPDDDPERARTAARAAATTSLAMEWYARTIARLGYTQRQVADPDPAPVDDVVAHGDPARIAAVARAHLAAGADHVVVQLRMGRDYAEGVDVLETLAPALADATA